MRAAVVSLLLLTFIGPGLTGFCDTYARYSGSGWYCDAYDSSGETSKYCACSSTYYRRLSTGDEVEISENEFLAMEGRPLSHDMFEEDDEAHDEEKEEYEEDYEEEPEDDSEESESSGSSGRQLLTHGEAQHLRTLKGGRSSGGSRSSSYSSSSSKSTYSSAKSTGTTTSSKTTSYSGSSSSKATTGTTSKVSWGGTSSSTKTTYSGGTYATSSSSTKSWSTGSNTDSFAAGMAVGYMVGSSSRRRFHSTARRICEKRGETRCTSGCGGQSKNGQRAMCLGATETCSFSSPTTGSCIFAGDYNTWTDSQTSKTTLEEGAKGMAAETVSGFQTLFKKLVEYTDAQCQALPSCGCIKDTTCGWCEDGSLSKAYSGTETGPKSGTCGGKWIWHSADMEAATNCKDCSISCEEKAKDCAHIRNTACGWCRSAPSSASGAGKLEAEGYTCSGTPDWSGSEDMLACEAACATDSSCLFYVYTPLAAAASPAPAPAPAVAPASPSAAANGTNSSASESASPSPAPASPAPTAAATPSCARFKGCLFGADRPTTVSTGSKIYKIQRALGKAMIGDPTGPTAGGTCSSADWTSSFTECATQAVPASVKSVMTNTTCVKAATEYSCQSFFPRCRNCGGSGVPDPASCIEQCGVLAQCYVGVAMACDTAAKNDPLNYCYGPPSIDCGLECTKYQNALTKECNYISSSWRTGGTAGLAFAAAFWAVRN